MSVDSRISTISWESVVLPDGSAEDLETGWNDAELMLSWVKANADTYNLDASRMIVGGRSRGSVFSWQLIAKTLPSKASTCSKHSLMVHGVVTAWTPTENVSQNSPPMKLTCYTFDGHDPDNGYRILDRYTELGIGDRAELAEDLGREPALYSDIATWCQTLLAK